MYEMLFSVTIIINITTLKFIKIYSSHETIHIQNPFFNTASFNLYQ